MDNEHFLCCVSVYFNERDLYIGLWCRYVCIVCVPVPLRFNNSALNTIVCYIFVISLCHMYIIN